MAGAPPEWDVNNYSAVESAEKGVGGRGGEIEFTCITTVAFKSLSMKNAWPPMYYLSSNE